MTWTEFWLQFDNILGVIRSVVDCIPPMISQVIFASVSFAAVWVLVKMIREVRS